jgi:hypothetical protein
MIVMREIGECGDRRHLHDFLVKEKAGSLRPVPVLSPYYIRRFITR